MLGLIVLFTVFLGLVGALVLLNSLQKRWSSSSQAAQPLSERVKEWLDTRGLHLPTASEIIPLLNQELVTALQTQEKEFSELCVVELLFKTELPQFNVTSITSLTDTSLQLECDIEWPMCVPGVSVRVTPNISSTPLTCHFLVEWMYAYAKVTLEEGSKGQLLVSYAHTTPPMMGVSCGVENQSLDDQKSAKLASSVADSLQAMFSQLCLKRVPMTPLPVSDTSLPVKSPSLPVVLVSAPEEVPTEPHEKQENHVTAENSNGNAMSEIKKDEALPKNETRESVMSEGSGASDTCEESGVSEGSKEEDPAEKEKDIPLVLIADEPPAYDESQTTPYKSQEEDKEPRPISPPWRRSSSYEQLTNSLSESPSYQMTDHLTSPERKALTMSMAGSEAESLYGADDRIPSTLVFEVKEATRVRNIVALSTAHANKLRRHFHHAQKLHIYNDHTFIAEHIKEKVLCVVCNNKISGIFRKQAYKCRDCNLTLHKQCHFKTDSLCPNTKVRTMNLIYPTNVSTVTN